MLLLPVLSAGMFHSSASGLTVGCLTGASHGVARMSTIFVSSECDVGSRPATLMLQRARLTRIDGIALLAVGAVAAWTLLDVL